MTDEIHQKLGRRNEKRRGSEIKREITNTLFMKFMCDAFNSYVTIRFVSTTTFCYATSQNEKIKK